MKFIVEIALSDDSLGVDDVLDRIRDACPTCTVTHPNKVTRGYQVEYQVLEGDNYAGGWVTRTAFVPDLSLVSGFQHVSKVCYQVRITGYTVPQSEIDRAIQAGRDEQARIAKVQRLKRAEAELEAARLELGDNDEC